MTESEKTKTPAKWAIVISGILIVVSVLAVLGLFLEPPPRDYAINNLLLQPSASALSGTIGVIIGSNILTIPAFILGIYAQRKNNPKGKSVAVISAILFVIITVRLFIPTPTIAEEQQPKSFIVSHEICEFSVEFPHPTKNRETYVGDQKAYLVESMNLEQVPHFRTEFISLPDPQSVKDNFKDVLEKYAYLANIQTPDITIGETEIGTKGTFSGIKRVDDIEIKFYGVVYIGDHSMISTFSTELLNQFPSRETLEFIDSIKKK